MAEAMGMKNRQQMGVGLVFAWLSKGGGGWGTGDRLMEIRKGWLEREVEPGFRNEEKEGVWRV